MFEREWLYHECKRLEAHETLDQFFAHLTSFVDQLGFYQCSYTALPSFYDHEEITSPPIILSNYDNDWMTYYLDKRYDQHDTILQHCLSGNEAPYLFTPSMSFNGLSVSEKKVIVEAGEADIKNGFALPIRNSFGGVGVVTLTSKGRASDFEKLYASRKEMVELFAYSFNEAILRKFAPHFCPPDMPNLTAKENEVILWLAAGLTYDQIADKLTIGISTVRKHVASVIKKLNARNTTHACALAVRWGLIS